MSDQPSPPPPPRINETCTCGAAIDVTAADAVDIVSRWRTDHPHQQPADRRQGAGGAATGFTARQRAPWGHIEQEVRA